MLGFLRIFAVRRTAASMKATIHFPASLLFAFSQRGKSGDPDIIKIRRTSTPDDVASVLLKERERQEVYGAGREINSTAERDEDDAEDEYYDGDDTGDKDEDDGEVVDDPEEDGGGVEVSVGDQKQQRRVSHGFHLVEGKMKHGMEDYLVAENRKMDGHNLGLYAIFDGHSGREVAEYLQSHLFDNILSEPDFWKNPVTAFKKAYRDTDNDILENVVGAQGGSTAVTAILIDQKQLLVANVGDSRAILIQRGNIKQITVDHESDKEEERDLVESKGGFVIKGPGNVPRVDGQLAMTRAFGDAKLKDHITVEPNVTIEKIDRDTDFIILASDGLWKVMSNEEVAECIRGIEHGKKAAEELITEALMRGSPDDISCVVVMFH
ncbi:probable protein phosphatase 2C 58 isoform X2 [Nicotiana tomentosiformis]|uniref:probable protein phosphatase 2C 58 isoform X2 n=1 Tax=Nicotiana tomentosiformis TaxID=4098 RepID=UPI00051BE0F9|nr:probable protein phosphatase 2C 58 isoform X2 [Nicotiana tomentosiformis]